MKPVILWMIALAAVPGSALAQNIAGTWQGTLKTGPQELRIVFKITLDDDKLKAVILQHRSKIAGPNRQCDHQRRFDRKNDNCHAERHL
jgi:hypothetical protein